MNQYRQFQKHHHCVADMAQCGHVCATRQFGALGFSRNPGKGHAVKNLAEGLKAEALRYKLSLGWEVKTEIPA